MEQVDLKTELVVTLGMRMDMGPKNKKKRFLWNLENKKDTGE